MQIMTKNFVSDALRSGLEKKPPVAVRVLLLLATAVFYVFALNQRYAMIDEFAEYRMEELIRITAAVYTAIFAVSFGVQTVTGKRCPPMCTSCWR